LKVCCGEAPQPTREGACAPQIKLRRTRRRSFIASFALVLIGLEIAATNCRAGGFAPEIVVSVADQELALIARGKVVKRFPVSTSKFGTGDAVGSYRTPLGETFVSAKVGDGLPSGAVIKNRNATGEILKADAPGRDAIVSRVIWLRGMDGSTANTRDRCIYIHGTAEEQRIGHRVSFGCIRMRSKDVIVLYNLVHIGTHVRISAKPLQEFLPPEEPSLLARAD
jgi:lipoprotein-anchoring transpeptidase ErfK/SrfK